MPDFAGDRRPKPMTSVSQWKQFKDDLKREAILIADERKRQRQREQQDDDTIIENL